MPRPSGLIWAAAVAFAASASAQAPPDCAESLTVTEDAGDPSKLELSYTARCRPYAALEIIYGGLRIIEESSRSGRLHLRLPRLDGTHAVTVRSTMGETAEPVPPGISGVDFVAVDWGEGERWGDLRTSDGETVSLGFRRSDGAPHLDLATGTGPFALTVPVTETTCGQHLSTPIITAGEDRSLPLTVRMPDCTQSGGTIVIRID